MFTASGRRLAHAFADLLLPPRCAGCSERLPLDGASGHAGPPLGGFCASCSHSVLDNERPCLRCAHSDGAPICAACAASAPPFSAVLSPYIYGGQLRVALLRFKLARATHLARPLGLLLAPTLADCESDDLIVPVPLHRRRLAQRGYNPAALLARSALVSATVAAAAARARPAAASGPTWRPPELRYDALSRTRDTPTQAGLSRSARQRNVAGAFAARASRVRGRRVLLVDDVMTTGATAAACARALARAGARATVVAVLARRC